MVLCRQIKKCCLLEKTTTKIPGWAVWGSILSSSVPNDHFSLSQEAAQSPDTFLFPLLCVPPCLSIAWAVSIPVSGGPSSSEACGNMFSCPFPPEHRAEGEEDLGSLLHVRSSFPQDLLSWFTSLFLFWGRISASVSKDKIKKQRDMSKSSTGWGGGNDTGLMVDALLWRSGICLLPEIKLYISVLTREN